MLYNSLEDCIIDLERNGHLIRIKEEVDPSQPYPSNQNRGNPKQNDNYYTTSLSLIYVFPESVFSGSGYGGKRGKAVNCPKKVL